MGRPIMSLVLEAQHAAKSVPIIVEPKSEPMDEPFVERWTASNAFDPDSDDFWVGQDVVYEAFVDPAEMSSSPLEPLSSGSDTTSATAQHEMSLEEHEVARRTRAIPETIIVPPVESATSQPEPGVAAVSLDRTPVQILRSTSTITDGEHDNTGNVGNVTIDVVRDMSMYYLPSASSTVVWTELDRLRASPTPMSPIPQSPSSPVVHNAMSPPPSVTPHIYSWDRQRYPFLLHPTSPSPSPRAQGRMRPAVHRRRESLPATISLIG